MKQCTAKESGQERAVVSGFALPGAVNAVCFITSLIYYKIFFQKIMLDRMNRFILSNYLILEYES
ncbi:MAG: hypothetical protein BWK80_35900 [Desulfobacteraceae bacterium IS3]|nr:MAG: hypothetical protein BWK80_35900 [Desulfobacteraceae bacterium IS3]